MGRFLRAGIAILPILAVLAADPGGRPAAGMGVVGAATTCPSSRSTEVVSDPERAVCATMATAIGTQGTARGLMAALPARLRCRIPPVDPGAGEVARDEAGTITGAGAGITVTDRDEANCDTLVSADVSGGHVTLYFPRGSLVLNFPSHQDYDPTLPSGILTTGPGLELLALGT